MNVQVGNRTLEVKEDQIANIIEPGSQWSEARDLEIGNAEAPAELEEMEIPLEPTGGTGRHR